MDAQNMSHEDYMREKVLLEDGPDMVNSPPHYNQAGIECIDAIKAAAGDGFQAHLQSCVIKYLWRFRDKENPLQDLRKARWYLDRLIAEVNEY